MLTFLRNSAGGFGTSVASTAYTTFRWSYSVNSLSITTESGLEESNSASGSTSAELSHDGSPDLNWTIGQFGVTKPRYGGKQAVSSAVANLAARGYKETTYDGTDSGTTTGSQSINSTSEIPAGSTKLSARENIPVAHANSDVLWTAGIGNIQQPASFTRNLTNNP